METLTCSESLKVQVSTSKCSKTAKSTVNSLVNIYEAVLYTLRYIQFQSSNEMLI